MTFGARLYLPLGLLSAALIVIAAIFLGSNAGLVDESRPLPTPIATSTGGTIVPAPLYAPIQ